MSREGWATIRLVVTTVLLFLGTAFAWYALIRMSVAG